MKELKNIGLLISTQDNRITDGPMFAVQKKVRDYGYDSEFTDEYVWISRHDHEEASEEEANMLSREHSFEDTGDWQKVYYKDRWEFVTACFTEQGCKDYLRLDGHNLGETRIYAYGSYRNEEFRKVRQALIELNPQPINKD